MSNIYYPVYKNLERGVLDLSYSIHIDDDQLRTYSSQISDLILRASAEIESISKELYKSNGGTKTDHIKYDSDALFHLNSIWKLDKKIIIISSQNCFQTIKELKPFVQNEISTIHGRQTYSWNISYQNLKHDRANSLNFGSVKYLFDIMSALFILNLYYKNQTILLYGDSSAVNFPIDLGSDLFSIKLHNYIGYDGILTYQKSPDFDECLYLVKYTEEYLNEVEISSKFASDKMNKLFNIHPKFIEYQRYHNLQEYSGENLLWDVLGQDDYVKLISEANKEYFEVLKRTQWMGVLNKHDF